MKPLSLDGERLSLEDLVAVARWRAPVRVAPDAMRRVARARVVIDLLVESGQKVYGVTTGFGKLRDVRIPREQSALLQQNLIRSHSVGVGAPFPEDVVRAAICLRVNTLVKGHSGVRSEVVDALVRMLNEGIYPYVPCKGSVGASGDLAPLSHLALVLTGDPDGRVFDPSRRTPGEAFVRDPREEDFVALGEGVSFRPVRLEAKEGVALVNGTQFMTALLGLAAHDSTRILRVAEVACAMSSEAQRTVTAALRDEVHQARNLQHQLAVAQRVAALLEGSEILASPLNTAFLRRAEHRAEEAAGHLARCGGMLTLVLDRTSEIRRRLSQARATAAEPPPAPAEIEVPETPARRQLRSLGEKLRPLRKALASLCADVNDLDERPETMEDLRKAAAALASALKDLDSAVPTAPQVQEDYSFRCIPQVLACAHRALDHVGSLLQVEMNSANDNPLLFPPAPPDQDMDARAYLAWLSDEGQDGKPSAEGQKRIAACLEGVLGGGNFHGEPLAIASDYLAMAMAEVGNIAERRIAHLIDENANNGLPAFLTDDVGLNSGFMMPQYTAAALVSENKVLCHPASVDSIPTSANAEDHNSMGTHAARKLNEVVDHVRWIVAIEVLTAHQAIQFREPLQPSPAIRAVRNELLANGLEAKTQDRVLYTEMRRAYDLVRTGGIGAENG